MPLRKHPRRLVLLCTAIALTLAFTSIDWRFISRAMTYPEQPIMAVDCTGLGPPSPGGTERPYPLPIAPSRQP